MGKGDRKGKATPKGIPPLAPVKPKGKQPRERGRFTKPEEDARKTALIARAHHYGKTPDKEGRAHVSAPWMGDPLGMCMAYDNGQSKCVRLWSVWLSLCGAERAYRVRILGMTGEAKGSSVEAVPERIQAEDYHTVDTRTPGQKDDDAVEAYMRWRGYLGQLDSAAASVLLAVRRGEAGVLWHTGTKAAVDKHGKPVNVPDCRPTTKGYQAVAALESLAHVVDTEAKRTRR